MWLKEKGNTISSGVGPQHSASVTAKATAYDSFVKLSVSDPPVLWTGGGIVVLDETPSHQDGDVSSQEGGDHSERLSLVLISSDPSSLRGQVDPPGLPEPPDPPPAFMTQDNVAKDDSSTPLQTRAGGFCSTQLIFPTRPRPPPPLASLLSVIRGGRGRQTLTRRPRFLISFCPLASLTTEPGAAVAPVALLCRNASQSL